VRGGITAGLAGVAGGGEQLAARTDDHRPDGDVAARPGGHGLLQCQIHPPLHR
jgi:hypothetical protein